MSVEISRPLFCLEVRDDYPLVAALNEEHLRACTLMVPVEGKPDMLTFTPGTFSPDYTPTVGRGRAIHYYDMAFKDDVLAFVEKHKKAGSRIVSEDDPCPVCHGKKSYTTEWYESMEADENAMLLVIEYADEGPYARIRCPECNAPDGYVHRAPAPTEV